MNAEHSLSNIFRLLKPVLRLPHPRVSRFCSTPQIAAFHQFTSTQRPPALAPRYHFPKSATQNRYHSVSTSVPSSPVPTSTSEVEGPQVPKYEITFTCKPCKHRSTHQFTKHSYHHGSVLITCPSCKNRHVISDHHKVFVDKNTTIEEIMQKNGERVKRGTLEGDFEIWDDGSRSGRAKDLNE